MTLIILKINLTKVKIQIQYLQLIKNKAIVYTPK